MSIQVNRYVVKQGVVAVNLNTNKVASVSSRGEECVDGNLPQYTQNTCDAKARRDSYVAQGVYGFLAMKL